MKKKKELVLPETLKFEIISGKSFIQTKSAAKLAGIHPVILEMGKKLMESVDGQAAQFFLGTPEMKRKAEDIESEFRSGLKKVAKAFGNALQIKSYREDNKLFFWYTQGRSKAKK